MAIFNYNSYVIYDRNGNSSNFAYTSSSEVDETGTLSDGEIGGAFEVSPADTITSSGAGPDGTFFGTTTGTSSQVYVIVAIDANTWAIYSSGSAADLVADLPNTINETNDTDQIDFTPCFLTGTLIATADGAASVESLKIGDEILSASGAPVLVRWIGRKVVSTRFGRAERLMPVRFSAGSLGCGLPYADLTVTADHAMLIDGVLCNAGALVNGTTIIRVPLSEMGDSYTVYHIETDEHEIIRANGAPAETFIDTVGRRAFDNWSEFDALYGDVPEIVALPMPRAMSPRQLPAATRARLGLTRAA